MIDNTKHETNKWTPSIRKRDGAEARFRGRGQADFRVSLSNGVADLKSLEELAKQKKPLFFDVSVDIFIAYGSI